MSQPVSEKSNTPATHAAPHGWLGRLDGWMAHHPWHPRLAPFLAYIFGLMLVGIARDHWPITYPFLYTLQCALVAWLLWRYRYLLPELTLSFHWLAVPIGIFVFLAWVWLGIWIANFNRVGFHDLGQFTRDVLAGLVDPHRLDPWRDHDTKTFFDTMGPRVGWVALSLRLLGMSILVPMFEELFIRSLMLRSLHRPRRVALGLLQFAQDLPMLGEWFSETPLGTRVSRHPPVFGPEFEKTPLGALSLFGVAASTVVFMISHVTRDWPGTIVCGVAYCLLLWAARRKGLGPVIWAHGITNALIWAYTLHTGDWRFL